MTTVFQAAIVYFGIVFGAGFIMGLIRVPFLVPRFGERTAELIEMPFMLAVIILASRWLVKRFALGGELWRPMIAGIVAAAILITVEFALVLRLRGLSPEEYVSSRDPVSAGSYYTLIAIFAVAPVIFAKLKKAPQ